MGISNRPFALSAQHTGRVSSDTHWRKTDRCGPCFSCGRACHALPFRSKKKRVQRCCEIFYIRLEGKSAIYVNGCNSFETSNSLRKNNKCFYRSFLVECFGFHRSVSGTCPYMFRPPWPSRSRLSYCTGCLPGVLDSLLKGVVRYAGIVVPAAQMRKRAA